MDWRLLIDSLKVAIFEIYDLLFTIYDLGFTNWDFQNPLVGPAATLQNIIALRSRRSLRLK